MTDSKNDEMAGSVSEPRAPEVKPAKSLWPRPYDNVRVEPSLEPAQVEDAPVAAPDIPAPDGDFDTIPADGHQDLAAPHVAPVDVGPERLDEPAPSLAPEDIADFAPVPDERTVDDIIEEKEASNEEGPTVEDILDEKEAATEAAAEAETEIRADRAAPSVDGKPEHEEAPAVSIDPLRTREDERAAALLGAADRQEPALPGSGENRSGQFIAMAAGIIVALALGTAALVYGASALGFSFGGGNDTIAANNNPPAPVPTPVVTASEDELKAAQQRIAELQEQLERLEAEKAEAAKAAETEKAEQTAAAPEAEASEPVPTPEPRPVAAAPAPTPAPVSSPAASAPSSPATPAASANRTADAAPARSEPTPAPAQPPPQQTARAEPGPGAPPRPLAPPPSYNTQPSYQQPGAASPEMPILQNWAVRDVYNGIAVVQSGRGAPMEIEPGDELPGGNRVLAIRRLGGAWAVVTERGIIAAR